MREHYVAISALHLHLDLLGTAWVLNMFPLVLGFAEVSRKRCEPKKGVVGVHATLGIGWVPGVGGPTRPPARRFSLFSRKIYAEATI